MAGDAHAGDKALAESLFEEGRRYLKARDYARACKAFASSFEAEATVGASLNLALCHYEWGNTATAWRLGLCGRACSRASAVRAASVAMARLARSLRA